LKPYLIGLVAGYPQALVLLGHNDSQEYQA